jgi:hypothetical protein
MIDGEVDTGNDFVEDFTLAELKHSTSMRGVSLARGRSATYFEDTLVSTLHAAAGDKRSFTDLLTPAGLAFIAGYADGIGPWKPYLVKTVADGVDRIGDQLGFADPQAKMAYFMQLGVDGVVHRLPRHRRGCPAGRRRAQAAELGAAARRPGPGGRAAPAATACRASILRQFSVIKPIQSPKCAHRPRND